MIKRTSAKGILHWERIKGPRAISAVALGTFGGAGLFPVAPGTMGSVCALPLAYAMAFVPWHLQALFWAALFGAGVWASKVIDEIMGSTDNQIVVIDEVVGLGITAWTAGTHWQTLAASFVLFRLFDITKPPPVRQVDRWSKAKASQGSEHSHWWSGFGVMADDLLAGIQALLVVLYFQYSGYLP